MIRIANRHFIAALSAVVFGLLSATCLAADAPTGDAKKETKPEVKLIKPDDAKDHEGEVVTVEFKVVDGREISSGVCFLNSSSDRQDPKRFTAFITNKGLKKFKEDPKTEKPADMYKGKKIQVTGAIKTYQKQFEIEVNSPDQIKIIEEEKQGDTKADDTGAKKS